jgi:hypothetical protein
MGWMTVVHCLAEAEIILFGPYVQNGFRICPYRKNAGNKAVGI